MLRGVACSFPTCATAVLAPPDMCCLRLRRRVYVRVCGESPNRAEPLQPQMSFTTLHFHSSDSSLKYSRYTDESLWHIAFCPDQPTFYCLMCPPFSEAVNVRSHRYKGCVTLTKETASVAMWPGRARNMTTMPVRARNTGSAHPSCRHTAWFVHREVKIWPSQTLTNLTSTYSPHRA